MRPTIERIAKKGGRPIQGRQMSYIEYLRINFFSILESAPVWCAVDKCKAHMVVLGIHALVTQGVEL